MKYLLMILATVAVVGSVSATSSTADDCCNGGSRCMAQSTCCAL